MLATDPSEHGGSGAGWRHGSVIGTTSEVLIGYRWLTAPRPCEELYEYLDGELTDDKRQTHRAAPERLLALL